MNRPGMHAANGQERVRLADFTVRSTISKGSFGTVYKVVRKADNRVYALKQIEIEGMNRAEREETIDEARVLASVSNPYIIKYYDCFIDHMNNKKVLGIVMEFAPGGTIHDKVSQAYRPGSRGMSEDVIWKYFIQSLVGISYLHKKRIIHRDIKSLNLFLDNEDNIKVGDLGIAKVLSDKTMFAKTIVGTPYYLSPELCEDKPYNDKSDVWALGVVLYEMCTGRHPFDAQNEGALIRKILQGKFVPVTGFSPALSEVVRLCLTQDYRRRPDCAALLNNAGVRAKAKALSIDLSGKQAAKPAPEIMPQPQVQAQMQPPGTPPRVQQQYQQDYGYELPPGGEDFQAPGGVLSPERPAAQDRQAAHGSPQRFYSSGGVAIPADEGVFKPGYRPQSPMIAGYGGSRGQPAAGARPQSAYGAAGGHRANANFNFSGGVGAALNSGNPALRAGTPPQPGRLPVGAENQAPHGKHPTAGRPPAARENGASPFAHDAGAEDPCLAYEMQQRLQLDGREVERMAQERREMQVANQNRMGADNMRSLIGGGGGDNRHDPWGAGGRGEQYGRGGTAKTRPENMVAAGARRGAREELQLVDGHYEGGGGGGGHPAAYMSNGRPRPQSARPAPGSNPYGVAGPVAPYRTVAQEQAAEAVRYAQYQAPQFGRKRNQDIVITGPSLRNSPVPGRPGSRAGGGMGAAPSVYPSSTTASNIFGAQSVYSTMR